jgi:Nucleotidyltransferase/DNA polymerase involved in DNA repair
MQRVVFLVDMNAFFISCETARNPALAGKPAAVAGDPQRRSGIILAANYSARKFGVKTTMTLREALKLCPNMILVPPDHSLYERNSEAVMEILARYTPVVEQNSIDEAWLDMTGMESLTGKPMEAARHIMDDIMNELGLWCSIGIAENKFLAKMASEMKKPQGITELWKDDLKYKMWPLPVQSMYGIGKQTAHRLQEFGIETIGELAAYKLEHLVKLLGKMGIELHERSNGIDNSPVMPHCSDEMKSIGRSTTLSEDISDMETAKSVLMNLADEVGMAARRHGKKGRKVHITIKYSDFQVITRQTTVHATYLTKDICAAGFELLAANWNSHRPVRLLGISISGFGDECGMDQMSIFQLTEDKQAEQKEEKLEKVMDEIRSKHGNSILNRAALLKKNNNDNI